MDNLQRTPPHNRDAEVAVLGGCMFPEAIHRIDWLMSSAFYREAHARTFDAMQDLAEAGKGIDLLTLTAKLRGNGDLEAVGGEAYLGAVVDAVPTAAGIVIHAGIVRDHAVLRELIIASTEIIARASDPEMSADLEKFVTQAERTICDIAARRHTHGLQFRSLDEIIPDVFEEIEEAYSGPAGPGIPSGLRELDRLTGGFFPGQLIVIGGRPGMGKTALAVRLAANMAQVGRKVAFFSFEMSENEIGQRLLSMASGVSLLDIRTGSLTEDDFKALPKVLEKVSRLPVYVNDDGGLRPSEGFSALRRLRAERGGIDAVFIDYLQLMDMGGRAENRTQEISKMTRQIKLMAVEFRVPVFLMSQLSRKTESRDNPRPVLADLRGSGSIEQDADVVFFPYRPIVYSHDPEDEGKADIIIGKQRNGPAGAEIPMYFEARTANFTEPAMARDSPTCFAAWADSISPIRD